MARVFASAFGGFIFPFLLIMHFGAIISPKSIVTIAPHVVLPAQWVRQNVLMLQLLPCSSRFYIFWCNERVFSYYRM
jgi:hypothetical protein